MMLKWITWKVPHDNLPNYTMTIAGMTVSLVMVLPALGIQPTPVSILLNLLFCDFVHWLRMERPASDDRA